MLNITGTHIKQLLFTIVITTIIPAHAQQYIRMKGYYRVVQTINSREAYRCDGMMEVYKPLDTDSTEGGFLERKFLGERLVKDSTASDETFLRMCMPNIESIPLIQSINSDEYSTRNNGDIYRWADKCGEKESIALTIPTDSGVQKTLCTRITIDNLAGREDHELSLDQLRMYGIVARMTAYEESETYQTSPTMPLVRSQKRQTFYAHYKGEDTDDRIDVVSEFFLTDRQIITKDELKRIRKEKNHIWSFSIPDYIP